jgi:hypothetical protein
MLGEAITSMAAGGLSLDVIFTNDASAWIKDFA